jgi:hypothetical protein
MKILLVTMREREREKERERERSLDVIFVILREEKENALIIIIVLQSWSHIDAAIYLIYLSTIYLSIYLQSINLLTTNGNERINQCSV